MKKILIITTFLFISMPAFAVCSITGGACSAPVNFEANSLKEKYVPNKLKNMQRTDYFKPQIINPNNTNVDTISKPVRPNPESSSFDSDYEFSNDSSSQTNIQE